MRINVWGQVERLNDVFRSSNMIEQLGRFDWMCVHVFTLTIHIHLQMREENITLQLQYLYYPPL